MSLQTSNFMALLYGTVSRKTLLLFKLIAGTIVNGCIITAIASILLLDARLARMVEGNDDLLH